MAVRMASVVDGGDEVGVVDVVVVAYVAAGDVGGGDGDVRRLAGVWPEAAPENRRRGSGFSFIEDWCLSSGLRIIIGFLGWTVWNVCVGYGTWFSKPKKEWGKERYDTMNEDTPVGVASAVKDDVTPSVVDLMMEKDKLSSLEDTISYRNYFKVLFYSGLQLADDNIPCERFANTAYGFFLGKKVAYPVVANYVRNTWGKYGLVRSMFSSSTGLFSFQFSSMDGLDAMLENGPWFIRNNPLILKKWHPDENLLKEDVSTVPVWVKLHGVPVTAFSEDGLSAIATKLGTPLMLDSYTSDMCMQS
ncbi:retrotransposon protein, putative, ty3-gypsy subclass [Tanacetum coccineum]